MLWAAPGFADSGQAPLSAIDWLKDNPAAIEQTVQPAPRVIEPPVARSGQAPEVTVAPLGAEVDRRIGLLPPRITGFAPDLWQSADLERLHRDLTRALPQRLPAGQDLLLTLLLAEADRLPGSDSAQAWLGARLDALLQLGAVEPGLALVLQADPAGSPALFERWMTFSLLSRREVVPCQMLAQTPTLHRDAAVRIFCLAQSGDFETAALLFGTAGALDVLSETEEALLARFLDPELFENTLLPDVPLRPSALEFRLFEAAGSPLPTAPLPRAFAQSDLSDDAGWKAQLEAAERLARAGVLPPNQLLGLYSDRRAAASGGIWDRVAAVQGFEAALKRGDAAAIAKTLPPTWRGMRAAELETVFADLFAKELGAIDLDGAAARIALRMALLSRSSAAPPPEPADDPGAALLLFVAQGGTAPDEADSATFQAILSALTAEMGPALPSSQRGAAALTALGHLADAGRGDVAALETALTHLRRLGLEDVARQAALQVLILRDGV